MALNTTDLTISGIDGWTAIVLTGTVINVTRITNANIEVKFGISSTSRGFVVNSGSTLKAEETFYARAIRGGVSDFSVITIVKD